MKTIWMLATLTVLSASSTAYAEETKKKSDSREKLDTAIPDAIQMLEKKKYIPFLKKFVVPEELKKIQERISLEQLAEGFGSRKAEKLKAMLKAVKELKPTYNDDKILATFRVDKEVDGRKSITFKKVDKYWYIKN